MRINLPSAILLSGTVLLFSTASGFAATAEDAGATAPQEGVQPAAADATAATEDSAEADKAGAKNPRSAAASARGSFKFGDNSKDAVTDPADAIEKARALHDKAMELAKANSITEATAKEKEAIEAAPHYWLPHAGMTYLIMTGKKRAFDAIHEASLSLQGKHDAVAERNCAKIFEQVHWMPPAVQALQAAIKMEPDNWVPKLAMADVAISANNTSDARRNLATIDMNAINSYEALSAIGLRYMQIEDFKTAKELISKAMDKAPDDKAKQECADRLYIAAVKNADAASLQNLAGQISEDFKTTRPEMILEGRIIVSDNPKEDAAKILADAANAQVGAPGLVFYQVGRTMLQKADGDKNGRNQFLWRRSAIEAFKNALTRNETEFKYQLALAAAQDTTLNYEGVQQTLTAIKEALPPDASKLTLGTAEPAEQKTQLANFLKYNLVKAFPLTHATPEQISSTTPPLAYKSTAHEWAVRITKASCSCHARSLAQGFSREPGVLFAGASKEDKPVVTVIFNSNATSLKKLMATSFMQNFKDPYEVVTDKPIEKISEVATAMYASDNARPAIVVKRNYALEMPTENSGRVAQTSESTPVH